MKTYKCIHVSNRHFLYSKCDEVNNKNAYLRILVNSKHICWSEVKFLCEICVNFSVFFFSGFFLLFFLDLQSEKQKHYKNTLNLTENRFADYVAPEFECIVCIFQNLLRGVRKYLSLTSFSLILSFWKRWPVTHQRLLLCIFHVLFFCVWDPRSIIHCHHTHFFLAINHFCIVHIL